MTMGVNTAHSPWDLYHALQQGEPGPSGERRPKQSQPSKPEPKPGQENMLRPKTRPGTRSKLENVPPGLLQQRGRQKVCTSFPLTYLRLFLLSGWMTEWWIPLSQPRPVSRRWSEVDEETLSRPQGTKEDPATTCYELGLIHPHLDDGEVLKRFIYKSSCVDNLCIAN